MNDIHTISLYALLGNSTFTVMMKSIFNLDLDGLDGDFFVRLTRENDRERKQRNVNDRKDLEQRVSNGDKLDTAEEATLSKITAAYESNIKPLRDNHKRGVKKRWSAEEDSMLVQLVGKCNFTKTKWTELSRRSNAATATTIA